MATDVLIQSGTDAARAEPMIVRNSTGRLFAVFIHTTLVIEYSDDNGVTWSTELNSGISASQPAAAIDSQDVIHIVYTSSGSKPFYVTYDGTSWGTPEQIDATNVDPSGRTMDVAIDSNDDVHAVWVIASNNEDCVYSKRSSGSWSAKTVIFAGFGTDELFPKIVVDSQDRLTAACVDQLIGGTVRARRYESGAWGGIVTLIGYDLNTSFGITVTSIDDVYVVWESSNILKYIKYTASSGLWGSTSGTTITTTNNTATEGPSLSADASDNLNLFWKGGASGTSIMYIQYTGSWGSDSALITTSSAFPNTRSCQWPVIDAEHTMVPTTGYHFNYSVSTGAQLRYYSTPADFPDPVDKNYTREDNGSLPSTDTNLANVFTSTEYGEVLTVDNIFATQTATDEYAIFEFKNKGNSSSDNIVVTWVGQTNIPPTTSTVYLQIYNRNSSTWETLDSNSSAGANANFSLSGSKTTSLSNYYNGSNWVSCRVYQLAA